ncbi:inner membrane protein YiaA [Acinetobacter sp. 1000160]|uniref:inner membrane protein YiaA n=1 Tax=Acinetobacter sp. 1000160 TaxID=1310800 RepID=UPI0004452146|nr:inner membrane protein YiaA [Acinetobacter sp. 1000160]EXB46784.1 inner membrane protein yiaA [Acinetobacter baumannii 146457]EYT23542.1 inner membrane protein yiaA [Acinetobacter sp. 1000160]
MNNFINRPTSAFIAASWVALLAGAVGFMIGLWNANMPLHEKGYYLVILLYGLFSAASLQKTVRDQLEEIPVTAIYYGLCWASMAVCIVLLLISLWNAELSMSEKGFYIMSFLLSLFGVVATQKNIRDLNYLRLQTEPHPRQLKLNEDSVKDQPQD